MFTGVRCESETPSLNDMSLESMNSQPYVEFIIYNL